MKIKWQKHESKIEVDDFNFDQYQPQGMINIPLPRRSLISEMAQELKVYNEKVEGKPAMKLSDLGMLDYDDFGKLSPVILQDCQISLRDGMVFAKPKDELEPFILFPVESPALLVFNLFNGKHTIFEANEILRKNADWTDEKVQAYVRGLFLLLVSKRVCVPG
jgi:hypothetical protein